MSSVWHSQSNFALGSFVMSAETNDSAARVYRVQRWPGPYSTAGSAMGLPCMRSAVRILSALRFIDGGAPTTVGACVIAWHTKKKSSL